MSYKMIVLDLDDTLLRDDLTISTRTKQALMKAQEMGIKVVLASGRPTFAMNESAKELALDQFESYLIAFNGAKIIACRTGKELYSSSLTLDDIQSLYKLSKQENVYIHTYMGDEIITDKKNPYTEIESEITSLPIKVVKDFIDAVTIPPVKVLMLEEPETLKQVEAKIKPQLNHKFSIMRSKPYFLEFIEKGVTKGASLRQIIERTNIKREDVIAIGDSYNDQEMIEFAGLGVAMGNAPDDIKEIADIVTDTNMNDGIAKIVDQYILNDN
ncbi:Cof-type HAD-IIB family hydrolase [Amphibacillus sp. Q70]|uniref:Cof-type HAD-IIB family hydrolase n=1 Tax=Amphibacillus sp. Q70 TaxID=3453416 RepID=UPI003F86A5E8